MIALEVAAPTRVEHAVAGLDAWLETMRGPGGYGGPTAHWWRQCLLFTGAGLDWRYEGIIAGYTELWWRTGEDAWLAKALRAADDLLDGVVEGCHYRASAFELNPATAGTPHEAACDAGLLTLALALRTAGRDDWRPYAACAERNLRDFFVGRLWDDDSHRFADDVTKRSFVPNKAATVCEALFLLSEVTGDDVWVERYALPALDAVVHYQVRNGGRLDGAITQNSLGRRTVSSYFPYYIARCVPAMVRGYRWRGDERLLDAAMRAMRFVVRWGDADGSFPAVVYADGRVNRYPAWIAALGDVLRAAGALRPWGFDADMSVTRERLLAGLDATGGVQTATGFDGRVTDRRSALPDFRDLLHVAGWCDKAFRYLAGHVHDVPTVKSDTLEADCTFFGRTLRFVETPEVVRATGPDGVWYQWRKGAPWSAASPEFWLS